MNSDSSTYRISAVHYFCIVVATVSLPVLLIGALLFWSSYKGCLAPVPLTGNISFDLKAEFIRGKSGDSCRVLAIGSSTTLNNLDSEVISQGLGVEGQFLNAASWARKIGQTRAFLEILLETFNPKLVILVTGPIDFSENSKKDVDYNDKDLRSFIKGSPYWLTLIKYFNLPYYYRRHGDLARMKFRRDIFTSLQFDKYGSVMFDVTRNSDTGWADRYNDAFATEKKSPRQYEQLRVIANLLQDHGIELIVTQAPIRSEAFKIQKEPIVQHWQELRRVAQANQIQFINFHKELKLSDEHFSDAAHLNSKGARLFTTALVDYVQKNTKFCQLLARSADTNGFE